MEQNGCARLWIVGEDRLQRVTCSLNESARLVTVGEVRGRLLTWYVRLAKAKVAGSNLVFLPISTPRCSTPPGLSFWLCSWKMEIAPPSRSPPHGGALSESPLDALRSRLGGAAAIVLRLKSVWRDPDRVRYAHVVQFAALAEAVHRGRGHAEPCSHLFDREK